MPLCYPSVLPPLPMGGSKPFGRTWVPTFRKLNEMMPIKFCRLARLHLYIIFLDGKWLVTNGQGLFGEKNILPILPAGLPKYPILQND